MRMLLVGLGVVAACSPRAPEPRSEPEPRPDTIRVPIGKGALPAPTTQVRHGALAPDEGTFAILAPSSARVGLTATARIRIVPGKGFHINTKYPFVVTLANGPGMTIAKSRLEGGRGGVVGDAETLADGELSIPITLTTTAAGDHTVRGTITFGICTNTVCLAREMPIAFTVGVS